MKKIPSAYNSRMRRAAISLCMSLFATVVASQQSHDVKPPSNAVIALPKASLWIRYSFQFQPNDDNGPRRWRAVKGVLPRGLRLEETGKLSGEINDQQELHFGVIEMDRSSKEQVHNCILEIETPLTASWEKNAQVDGNRIDGSVKVSNTTGRDFDLTFAVLAVNEIGRATAIGYQHFSLKQNTRDLKLPFGDTLSPGNYTVNVDVVAEEPVSRMIFRTRLVAARLAISTGP